MHIIDCKVYRSPDFASPNTQCFFIFQAKDLQIGYVIDSDPALNLSFERNQKVKDTSKRDWETTLLKRAPLGTSHLSQVKRAWGSSELFRAVVEGGNRQTPLEAVWTLFGSSISLGSASGLSEGFTKHWEPDLSFSGRERRPKSACVFMNFEKMMFGADEPTNHLDVDTAEELRELWKDIRVAFSWSAMSLISTVADGSGLGLQPIDIKIFQKSIFVFWLKRKRLSYNCLNLFLNLII